MHHMGKVNSPCTVMLFVEPPIPPAPIAHCNVQLGHC